MRLLLDEEHYLGYSRRAFGCQSCDGAMTEWPANKFNNSVAPISPELKFG